MNKISCQIFRWTLWLKCTSDPYLSVLGTTWQRVWLTHRFHTNLQPYKSAGNNSAGRSECSHQPHLVFPGRARLSIQIEKPVTAAAPKRIVRSCASFYGCSYKTGEQEHMISPDLCLMWLCKTTRSMLLFNTILVELNNVQPLIFFNIKHDLILNQIFQWRS